jgi:hypothetical protein
MATAIVVGLGALVIVLLQDDLAPTATTSVTTTTTTTSPTTASSTATTSTTTADQRLAEVETILQELWFGWFDAIYRKDAVALWEVVATTRLHDDGVAAMGLDGLFTAAPSREGVVVTEFEILLDRPDCLVVHESLDFSAFRDSALTTTVDVLWPANGGWRFATAWTSPTDLWLGDCDSMQREVTP